MQPRAMVVTIGVLVASAQLARADRVHLVDGGVLEGQAETQGDKVVVTLDSGTLSLPRESVKRVEHVEKAALPERADNPSSAAKGTTSQHVQAQDADARKTALEQQRLAAEAEAAEHARDAAKLEVEAQRVALEREKLELARAQSKGDAESTPASAEPAALGAYPVYYGYYHPLARDTRWQKPTPRAHTQTHTQTQQRDPLVDPRAFPIAGVRDPRDKSWPIPGVRDPLAR